MRFKSAGQLESWKDFVEMKYFSNSNFYNIISKLRLATRTDFNLWMVIITEAYGLKEV